MRADDGGEKLRVRGNVADLPSGDRKSLPRRPDAHNPVANLRQRKQGLVAPAVEDEVLVNFVRDGDKIVPQETVGQKAEIAVVEYLADRIHRRVDDDRPRARRDRRLERVPRQRPIRRR